MLEIMDYSNRKNENIKIFYSENYERVIKWNLDTKDIREIEEFPGEEMKYTILDVVCDDFKELHDINNIFELDSDELVWFEGEFKSEFMEDYKLFFN